MPDKPNASVTSIRTQVSETALESFSAEEALSPEFINELRKLLQEAKPPKGDAIVRLFEKHAEGGGE